MVDPKGEVQTYLSIGTLPHGHSLGILRYGLFGLRSASPCFAKSVQVKT